MNSERLLDFLKTGMGTMEGATDELLRQFINYLLVSTALHLITVMIIFGFLWASIGKGIKWLDDAETGWKAALRVSRVVLICSSIIYSYLSVKDVIKPLVAPHVWLIENGIKLLKK